ncbi:signal recognition particle-docking protein FtsY [Noviherbaspirillum sp. Root189]|uniref:signal recognition particle-docking protein FtsY n=1 Tax=Noviherbaspirillum sp. Root189 TaxID=1736487 RepID=UPI0007111C47|nr:signal recognition particle-docking protein FtsY [Noviherbaspirillum sp. Root189]KRB92256.1 signal recognition particle-docking protein FtsY [Noviherbaspirillum sp. Root189]
MFSFFKKKPKDTPAPQESPASAGEVQSTVPAEVTPAPVPVTAPVSTATEQKSWFGLFKRDAAPAPQPEEELAQDVTSPTPASSSPPAPPPMPALAVEEENEEEGEIVPAAPIELEQKRSWMQRLKSGLSKTSSNLTTLFVGAKIDEDLYEELESALLMSDAGVEATQFILDSLKKKVKSEKLTDAEQVKTALRALLIDMLTPLQKPMVLGRHQPLVMMIAGVNGAGKTTTIGKLAKHLQAHQQSVLLAAGDTFRAAAREQLAIWGERNNISVIAQESGDPAAVAFDAVQSARARGTNVVMIDTAGRLPTQLHLMEELKKVRRVIGKGMASAPHEILLVIDGNTGQNALAQVKAFDDALGLTGLIVTKLDGTAKGGVLAAIAKTRPVPVYFIGVGEKIEDLQPFNAEEFVEALLT